MRHYDALMQLMPIDLGDVSNRDMCVEGKLLDLASDAIVSMLPEWFPSTVATLLDRWEREYGLAPRATATEAARRSALHIQYVYIGSLTKYHFMALAAVLGYDITIVEGGEANRMFRADISRAGDRVYAAALMWEWTVTTLNRPPESDLINLFTDLNPPHMNLNIIYEGDV